MYSVCADFRVCVGGHAHQLAEVHVQPQLDLILVFTLVSVLNGSDCMCALDNMNYTGSFACDQQRYSHFFLCVNYWDGSLTCTGAISSVSACCAHCCSCSCYNSFVCLCNFMFFLSCYFSTCNSFFVPFSAFARSSCCVVTS